MKIYVITHKKYKLISSLSLYETLYVGCYFNTQAFEGLKDDLGEDNISARNKNYCELTGIYWVWKNSDEDIVGICHYRRYFTKYRVAFSKIGLLHEKDIKRIMDNYDIILPQKNLDEYNGLPAKVFFENKHGKGIWEKVRSVVDSKSPDFLIAFDQFAQETTGYCFNMCVMRKEQFDEYCEWLFDIIFELENIIDLTGFSEYNQRLYGFIAERLINVWVMHKKLRIKEIPVFNTERDIILIRAMNHFKKA